MDKLLISRRFKEVLEDLKSTKKLPSYEYLAANYSPSKKRGKSFISEMVRGSAYPNTEVVQYLEERFGVSRDYIYEGKGRMYKEGTSKVQVKNNNMENSTPDLMQELINSLKKNIEVLEKHMKEYEEREKILIKANADLKSIVHANLKTVLDNQLTMTALSESFLKAFSELMIDEPEQQQAFRIGLHKVAFERLTGVLGTGNHHLVIDSESIVASE